MQEFVFSLIFSEEREHGPLRIVEGVDQVDRGHSVHVLRNAGSNKPSNLVKFYLEYFLRNESMDRLELLDGSTRSAGVIPFTSYVMQGQTSHPLWFSSILNTS